MPDTSIKIKDVDGVVHNVDTHKLVDGDERQVFVLGDLENSGLIDLAAFIAQTHTDLAALLTKLGSVTLDTATLGALETIQIGSSALPTGAATAANQATSNTSLAAIVSALASTLTVGLPAGAATDATLTTVSGRLATAAPTNLPGSSGVIGSGTVLLGYTARETAGATAVFRLRAGDASTGAILATVSLGANESARDWYGPSGIAAAGGIFLDKVSGTFEGGVQAR